METWIELMELLLFDESIPYYVKSDVNKRIDDWCSRGGVETDDYIVVNQYNYLLRVKELYK